MNFNDFEYHPSKLPKDPKELDEFWKQKEIQFKEELKTLPQYLGYFKGVRPDCIEAFIKSYTSHKVYLLKRVEEYIPYKIETKEMRYQQRTERTFRIILQKKLFNIQCLWRAEKIEIPEIRLCADFYYWEDHVEDCPFLEPVTEQEIEVMKMFLRSDNYSDSTQHWLCRWQDYEDMHTVDEEGFLFYLPEWYDFYDIYMGTTYLMKLPNIRGDKESFYRKLTIQAYKDEQLKNKKDTPVLPPTIALSYLHARYEDFTRFMHVCENEYVKTLNKEFNKAREANRRTEEDEEVDEAIRLLEEAEQPVYMPGGLEWKEAIIKCGRQYINTIIADELDVVFESYQMLQDLKMTKSYDEKTLLEAYHQVKLINMMEEDILGGRELNGEPRDFNF
jgi:hypothetical protein